MTTYTAIAGTETQSGKPITESLMTRMANNLLAVVEQDPTAPVLEPKVLVQNSGSVYGYSSRSNGGSLGGTSGASGWYDRFELTIDNDFDSAVLCDFQCDFLVNAGTPAVRLYVNGSLRKALGTWPNNAATEASEWNISLPTGTNTITVALDAAGGNVYGWAKVRGSWL